MDVHETAGTYGGGGPHLAPAFVATSLGVLALGLLQLLRTLSATVDEWLTWRPAAEMIGPGAISTGVALLSWVLLASVWRVAGVSRRTALLCLALIVVGLVLASAPFDQLLS